MSSRALLALWSQGCHKHFQLVRFPLTLGLCVCLVVVIHGSVPLSPQFYTAAICWCFSWRPVPNRKPRVVWLHSRSSFRDCIVSTLYVGVTKVRVVSLPRYSKSFVTPLMVGEFICGASRQHADYGWPWPDKPILSFAYDNPTNTSKNVPVDYYYYYYSIGSLAVHPWVGLALLNELLPLPSWLRINSPMSALVWHPPLTFW